MRLVSILGLLATVAALPAQADERTTLGLGRIFSNDFLGDGQDRWRTGSYSMSILRGAGWDGRMPGPGARLLEYRLRAEIISPSSLYEEGWDDRRYVGALTFGLHSHFAALGGEVAAGADVTAAGAATHVIDVMDSFHELISAPNPSDEVRENQIGDGVHPSVTLEYARPLRISRSVTLRPFAGAEAGVEDLARLGMDVIWGGIGHGDLWVRDGPSGQLYRGIEDAAGGLSVVAGADWSAVGDSVWLPEPAIASDDRLRARAGVHWQIAPEMSFFYGVSYLSPEFEAQSEGQVTGQLKLNFNF